MKRSHMKPETALKPASKPAAPSPRRVVHIQTVVQSVFGLVDEEGNVLEKKTAQAEIPVLKPEAFASVVDELLAVKQKLSTE